MFDKTRKKRELEKGEVDRENIQSGLSKPRKGKNLKDNIRYSPVEEKIPVEIRDIIRIRPQDFHALKNSFEEWSSKWE